MYNCDIYIVKNIKKNIIKMLILNISYIEEKFKSLKLNI